MSAGYLSCLAASVAVILGARFVLGFLPLYTAAPLVVAVALVAVGVTMYDGGPLRTHLVAISGSVVILAGAAAVVVGPPWRRTPAT